MKKCILCLALVALFCKAEALPDYDVEIDGLCYVLNLGESTAELVHIAESVTNAVVPQVIMVSNRSFEVTSIDLWFGKYDYHFIRTISLPSSIINLRLGGSTWQVNSDYFPRIAIISIPSSVEVVSGISCIKELSSITIPSTVKEVGCISYLPNLRELIIEDGVETLRWKNADCQFEETPSNLDNVYLGRQLIPTNNDSHAYFGSGLYPDNVVIGPFVRDLTRYNMYPQTNVIPNTVIKGYLGEDSFDSYGETTPISVVFNDGSEMWVCAYYGFTKLWKRVSVWYIGRPGVGLRGIRAIQLTVGPLLTSQLATAFFHSFDNQSVNHNWIKGENSFIKLYQANPPELPSYTNAGSFFDNETFMNTPLYVPRGSKHLYE